MQEEQVIGQSKTEQAIENISAGASAVVSMPGMAVRGLGRLTNGIIKVTNVFLSLALEVSLFPLKIGIFQLKYSEKKTLKVVGNILLAPIRVAELALGATLLVAGFVGESLQAGTYYLSKPSINLAKAILKKGNPKLMKEVEEKHPDEYYFSLPNNIIISTFMHKDWADKKEKE